MNPQQPPTEIIRSEEELDVGTTSRVARERVEIDTDDAVVDRVMADPGARA